VIFTGKKVAIQLDGLATPIARDGLNPSMGLVVAILGNKHLCNGHLKPT